MKQNIFKTKTFWAGISTMVGAIAGYMTGEFSMAECFQAGMTGLIAVFLRAGIAKGQELPINQGRSR